MTIEELAQAYCPLLNRLMRESTGITYEALFLEPNLAALSSVNGAEVMKNIRKAYLLGILERSHLACVTSIARSSRWIDALADSKKRNNALEFSAALRGFLEAASDAHDVMAFLPGSLHKLFRYAYLVFIDSPDVDNMMVAPKELEDRLIHYAYARRHPRGAAIMENHLNKTNADYIRNIEQFGVPGAKDLYGELCELTHPAAASVFCFLDEQSNSLRFNPNKDESIIGSIASRYSDTIVQLAQYSINPALVSLSFLNRLFPEWPGRLDAELAGIGNTSAQLDELDRFMNAYIPGAVDRVQLA